MSQKNCCVAKEVVLVVQVERVESHAQSVESPSRGVVTGACLMENDHVMTVMLIQGV